MKKKPKANAPAKSSGVGTILWLLAIAVATMGVFWLPWQIPFSAPVVGESYALGFNNHVGVLALGLSIFLGAAACWFGVRAAAFKWLQQNPRFFPPWREAPAEYIVLICFSTLMAGFILFWSSYLVDPAWCEARGFMYGMDLLALGQVPYRDFMYNYGPATIYLPLWLSDASRGLLSFEQAYAVFLVLFTIGGFTAVFVFLRSLELPRLARPFILGLVLIVWTSLSMGLQYTPLRFFIVPLSLVFFDAVASGEAARGIAQTVRIALGAAIAVGACLAISPEMGISATVAVASYAFILILRRSIANAAACFLGAVVVFAATLIAFPGYLDSVFAFGGGGGNFPIYPNLNNLCMVAMSLIVLPPLIVSAITNSAEKRSPLALSLAVGGGILLPAAFGRCDPGHVGINGMILIIMMFPAAAAAGKMAFRVWIGVYAIVWMAILEYSYWTQYIPNFTSAATMHDFYQTHPDQVAAWKAKWNALLLSSPHGKDLHWGKVLPFPDGLDQLTSKGRVLLTSSSEGNLWLARFLLLQKDPPREYFHAYSQGVSTPAQIETKVQQDLAYQFLIVPESVVQMVGHKIDPAAYQEGTDSFLSSILFFPVTSEVKNSPYLPDTEYAARMLTYYKVIGRYESYLVLERNPGKTTP
jgi:hypothetical protein